MRVRARACVFTCSSMSRALLAPSLSSLSGEGKLRKDDTSGARGAEAGVETWREHHSETHGQGGAVGPGAREWTPGAREWTPGAREWTPGARGETRENGMVVAHRISCLYSRAFILLFLLLLLLLLLILLVIFFLPLPIFLFLLLLLYTFFIRLLIVIIIIIVVDFWLTLVITAAKQTS